MRVFLTGGTGYTGSFIVKLLVEAGHEVRILAREPRRVTGLLSLPKVEIVEGVIEDREIVAECVKGRDAVIHTALNEGKTAVEMLRNDSETSLFLFESAAQAGCTRAIFTSTTMALGDYRPDMTEEMKTRPFNFYGAAKASVENFMFAFSKVYGMKCNVIRPGSIVGRPALQGGKDRTPGNIEKWVKMALKNEVFTVVRNDGTQSIFGGDLARIYLAILDSHADRQIYFGLGARFIDSLQIVEEIIKQTGSKSTVSVERNPHEDSPKMFDVTKIKRDFGFVFDAWPEYVGMISDTVARCK